MAFGYQSLQRVHSIRLYHKTTLLLWNPEISSVGIIWNLRISPFFMEQSSKVSQEKIFDRIFSYKIDCLRSLGAKIEQKSLGESCRGYPIAIGSSTKALYSKQLFRLAYQRFLNQQGQQGLRPRISSTPSSKLIG